MFLFKKLFLLTGVTALCVSSPARAETLEQALSTALSQHPQVEGAMATLRSAEEAEKEEYSGYFPELSVSTTGGRIFGDNSTSRGLSVTRGSGYSYLWEGSVSARQMLFDGMETKNRVDAAKADIRANALSIADIRETLALKVVRTYLNLLRVRKGLSLLRGQEKIVADYLSRITTMVNDGAADEAELQQAKDVAVILDNFIADYEGQARALESDYVELTGHFPEGALEPPVLNLQKIPEDVQTAIEIAKAGHPLLQSAQFETKSSEYGVKAERAAYIPKFDGELSYMKTDKEDVIGGEVEDAKAVVRMNWEFETGGAQKARIKQRTYEYKEAVARADDVRRQIERSVRQAYAERQTARRRLENQKKRHELNQKLLETYKVQFEGALISVLQIMRADNQVLLTKLEESNAQSRVMISEYGILAAMGHLQKALSIETSSASSSYLRHAP
jgi:adhesin transport system outer membrane protein